MNNVAGPAAGKITIRQPQALKILRVAGHQIRDAHIPPLPRREGMRIWIDGVPCTFVGVFQNGRQELRESGKRG
jgi:hypothetical protein